MTIHPLAGKPVPESHYPNIDKLISNYYDLQPDPAQRDHLVQFGTSGHRGSSLKQSFNENHIVAITEAVCDYRQKTGIHGPLIIGYDTHALSFPAFKTAIEVLVSRGVETLTDLPGSYTPTPVISHSILTYNQDHDQQADGIVITPSHNPPEDGGFKYNPPSGGPAPSQATDWIQNRANDLLRSGLKASSRVCYEKAIHRENISSQDFRDSYVRDLGSIIHFDPIAKSGLKIGVDPMGGAGVHYWEPIADRYHLNLDVVNQAVDPGFTFMCLDKDGKIRMDCSSPYAMAGLIQLKDRYDIAFGNDPDTDRHGIVCPSSGLMNPNHYLSVAIQYLFKTRKWPSKARIGKTLVSSAMIDRVASRLQKPLCEVPVGFKWFVDGLLDGTFGFGGEESAGASFLRLDGRVWTTDKDGIILNLLAAEMTAVEQEDPGETYKALTREFGNPHYQRIDTPASHQEKARLKSMTPEDIKSSQLAGDPILQKLTRAPGNQAPIGGLKVVTQRGWFAARPSGTEAINKLYAESFESAQHLAQIQEEAVDMIASLNKKH